MSGAWRWGLSVLETLKVSVASGTLNIIIKRFYTARVREFIVKRTDTLVRLIKRVYAYENDKVKDS